MHTDRTRLSIGVRQSVAHLFLVTLMKETIRQERSRFYVINRQSECRDDRPDRGDEGDNRCKP